MGLAKLYQYILGPKLYSFYARADANVMKVLPYTPNNLERYGDNILTSIYCASKIILYTSPIILPFYLRRDLFSLNTGVFCAKFVVVVSIVSLVSLVTRSLGRMTNPLYPHFIDTLNSAHKDYNHSTKSQLERYDFQFKSWPVDFDVREVENIRSKTPVFVSLRGGHSSIFSVTDWLARLLTHSFGISLVYPGSMSLMGVMLETPLLEGRCKLVMEHSATRNKIRTRDNNTIDTMFVDKTRETNSKNGNTLVVCCEGNAGFYELGVMITPLAAGYSVLGWNHPGFGGSSGAPFPDQERNAVDAVMQFAIHKLKFKPENIIVIGWSIGGYTSTWLALNYPQIKGLILDATFDHLEPLAIPRMPSFMSSIVSHAVNNYIGLDVEGHLRQFSGPVTIIRRLKDEMITTKMLELSSNRGNNLLISLLEHRYPNLVNMDTKSSLLAHLSVPLRRLEVDMSLQDTLYKSYLTHHDVMQLPIKIGEDMSDDQKIDMLFYLANQYMKDMDSSHCTPLTTSLFQIPWNPLDRGTPSLADDVVEEKDSNSDIELIDSETNSNL